MSVRACFLVSALVGIFLTTGLVACHNHAAPPGLENADVHDDREEIQNCQHFVQRFYDWYIDQLNTEAARKNGRSAEKEVRLQKPEVLTPELREMLQNDDDAAVKSHGYIVGLDFDPFINAQDWQGKYTVNSVIVTSGTCRASVWSEDSGKQTEIVVPELKQASGKWVFVNFHYPGRTTPENENLIATLRMLREEREHPKHSKKD